REQPRLGHVRVDGGDEGALTEEVRGEPADEEDQTRAQYPGHSIENEVGYPSRAWNGQGVDGEGDRDHEDAPEDHEANDVRRGPPRGPRHGDRSRAAGPAAARAGR